MHAKIYVVPVRFKWKKYKIVRIENFFEIDPHKNLIELEDMKEIGRKGVECIIVLDSKYRFK
jgi:hypothetical protein